MKIRSGLERVSRIFARIGGALILVSAILVSLDVVFRNTLRLTWFESYELSTYAFAISTAFGFAWALLSKAHIRIEVIYSLLPRRGRAWLDALALGVLAATLSVAIYWCTNSVWSNVEMGARSSTSLAVPLAIPQGLWLLGLAWFLVCAVFAAVAALGGVLAGRHDDVVRAFGVSTVDEEVGSAASSSTPASEPAPLAARS